MPRQSVRPALTVHSLLGVLQPAVCGRVHGLGLPEDAWLGVRADKVVQLLHLIGQELMLEHTPLLFDTRGTSETTPAA